MRFGNCRNTLCTRKGHAASVRRQSRQRLRNISRFSNRSVGAKDPLSAAADLFRGSLDHFLRRRVRRRKYRSVRQCANCPPLAGDSCAQRTASLLPEKPEGVSRQLSPCRQSLHGPFCMSAACYHNIDKHMFKKSVFAVFWEKFPEKSRAESEKVIAFLGQE